MNVNLNFGDKISRPKAGGLVTHVGVYIGNGFVFHNLPERGEHVSSLAEFAAGQPITVVPAPIGVNLGQLNWRIQERLNNPKAYSAGSYNCEDSANYVLTGETGSPQRQGWAFLGFAAIAVAVLAR